MGLKYFPYMSRFCINFVPLLFQEILSRYQLLFMFSKQPHNNLNTVSNFFHAFVRIKDIFILFHSKYVSILCQYCPIIV
jgi:hypothetical protein